jgi:hypothetical protein
MQLHKNLIGSLVRYYKEDDEDNFVGALGRIIAVKEIDSGIHNFSFLLIDTQTNGLVCQEACKVHLIHREQFNG